ncbi:MAG: hypothetical protein GY816_00585 [Cytophagales bacterium]|nr:hypothetical protein [Cytophagales bacterium]
MSSSLDAFVRITVERNFLRVFVFILMLFLAALISSTIYFANKRELIEVTPLGEKKAVPTYEWKHATIQDVEFVLQHLENSLLSYNHDNVEESLQRVKAFMHPVLWEKERLSREDGKTEMKNEKSGLMFFRQVTRLETKKSPFVVSLYGKYCFTREVKQSKGRDKNVTTAGIVGYKFLLEESPPNKDNPYGLTVTKRRLLNITNDELQAIVASAQTEEPKEKKNVTNDQNA